MAKHNNRHPKTDYMQAIAFIVLTIIIFGAALILSNYKDSNGMVDIKQSKLTSEVGEELKTSQTQEIEKGSGVIETKVSQEANKEEKYQDGNILQLKNHGKNGILIRRNGVWEMFYKDAHFPFAVEKGVTTVDDDDIRFYLAPIKDEGDYNDEAYALYDKEDMGSYSEKEFVEEALNPKQDKENSFLGYDSEGTAIYDGEVYQGDLEEGEKRGEQEEVLGVYVPDAAKPVYKDKVEWEPTSGYETAKKRIQYMESQRGAVLITNGGWKFVSNGDGTWTPYHEGIQIGPLADQETMFNYADPEENSDNCGSGQCFFDEYGDSIYGNKLDPTKVAEDATEANIEIAEKPEQDGAPDVPEPIPPSAPEKKEDKDKKAEPEDKKTKPDEKKATKAGDPKPFTAAYGDFDQDGDLVIEVSQNEKVVGKYFYRDKTILSEDIYVLNDQGQKVLCEACSVEKTKKEWYIVDQSRGQKQKQKFKIGDGKTDPDDMQIEKIKKCKNNWKSEECIGAAKLAGNRYDKLNEAFRSQLDEYFGKMFDKWFRKEWGMGFSEIEYAIYNGMCTLEYYDTGEDEDVEVSLTGFDDQSYNKPKFALDIRPLKDERLIATISGAKEKVTENIYRYSISLQTLGATHAIVYLQNKCTMTNSYTIIDDVKGWRDEFVVQHPYGVKRKHYAENELTFSCENPDVVECRFSHVCFEEIGPSPYLTQPECKELAGNNDIVYDEEGNTVC